MGGGAPVSSMSMSMSASLAVRELSAAGRLLFGSALFAGGRRFAPTAACGKTQGTTSLHGTQGTSWISCSHAHVSPRALLRVGALGQMKAVSRDPGSGEPGSSRRHATIDTHLRVIFLVHAVGPRPPPSCSAWRHPALPKFPCSSKRTSFTINFKTKGGGAFRKGGLRVGGIVTCPDGSPVSFYRERGQLLLLGLQTLFGL